MKELTTEELSEFLLKVVNNTGGIRRKIVALKHFVDEHMGERYNKSTNEQWDEIYEDYLKDEYPVFGGPFTNALTFIEWLKLNYDVPQNKQNGK